MSVLRVRRLLPALLPAALCAGEAEMPPGEVTPPNPPEIRVEVPVTYLVDKVIPAYGTHHYRPYRKDSDAEALYNEIRTFTADVEARIATGELHRLPLKLGRPVDPQGQPIAEAPMVPLERELLPEEEKLLSLLERLAVLDIEIPYPNHYEQWHFDNSWRDLERAAQGLRVTLDAEIYEHLELAHHSYKIYYQAKLRQAQHAYANRLLAADEQLSPSAAQQRAYQEVRTLDPYPAMNFTGDYAPVEIPPVGRGEATAAQIEVVRVPSVADIRRLRDEGLMPVEPEPEPEPGPQVVEEAPGADQPATADQAPADQPMVDDQVPADQPMDDQMPPADQSTAPDQPAPAQPQPDQPAAAQDPWSAPDQPVVDQPPSDPATDQPTDVLPPPDDPQPPADDPAPPADDPAPPPTMPDLPDL